MIFVLFKMVFEKNIIFKLNKENFFVIFFFRKLKNNIIVCLFVINFNGYVFVVGFGYFNFVCIIFVFGNLMMFCWVYKKIYLFIDGYVILNY